MYELQSKAVRSHLKFYFERNEMCCFCCWNGLASRNMEWGTLNKFLDTKTFSRKAAKIFKSCLMSFWSWRGQWMLWLIYVSSYLKVYSLWHMLFLILKEKQNWDTLNEFSRHKNNLQGGSEDFNHLRYPLQAGVVDECCDWILYFLVWESTQFKSNGIHMLFFLLKYKQNWDTLNKFCRHRKSSFILEAGVANECCDWLRYPLVWTIQEWWNVLFFLTWNGNRILTH